MENIGHPEVTNQIQDLQAEEILLKHYICILYYCYMFISYF